VFEIAFYEHCAEPLIISCVEARNLSSFPSMNLHPAVSSLVLLFNMRCVSAHLHYSLRSTLFSVWSALVLLSNFTSSIVRKNICKCSLSYSARVQ
jgi:hypothetical protein